MYFRRLFFSIHQSLLNKAKKLGLITKDKIKLTRILLLGLKIYLFFKEKDKDNLFGAVKEYIAEIKGDKKFKKFLEHYENNWVDSNFIDFDSIWDEIIKHRNNNNVELFHWLLNNTIETKHLKISFLIEKLKMIIVNKYTAYIIADNKIENSISEKYNIFNYIYNFAKKYS